MAVDSSNNAYVTGLTASSNFPTTPGALQPDFGFGGDAFVSKLSFCERPKRKNECRRGGWRRFCEPSFKNEGACVAFVNDHR